MSVPSAKWRYDAVPSSSSTESNPRKQTPKLTWVLASLFLISTLAIALSYTLIIVPKKNNTNQHRPCGSTVDEAISLGCTFDALSDLWLPVDCPRKYTSEYLNFKNGTSWRYWADEAGQVEIFNRSDYVNGLHYWSQEDDHLVHCAFMIMRLADSLETGVGFGRDDRKPVTAHLAHCAVSLLGVAVTAQGMDEINTETRSGIGYCPSL